MKKGILWLGLSFLLVAALVLASCAPAVPGEQEEEEEEEEPVVDPYEEYVAGLQEGEFPVPREAFEQAIEEGELAIYDWAGWWPEEVYEGFSEEFGIEITRDHFSGGPEVVAKFSLYPETPYDLILSLGIEILIPLREVGALQQINPDWIPNVFEYVPKKFIEMEYDPGWKYSVATHFNPVSYSYNTKYVDDPRLPSWGVLYEPMEEFKGRITLVAEMQAVIGAALKYLGYHFFSIDEVELMEARDLLMELKPNIMAIDSWPSALLLTEEALIIQGWYGNGWFLKDEFEAIMPALPTEGSFIEMGLSFLLIGSPNPAAAHLFLNYLYRPEVWAQVIEVTYDVPIQPAVLEFLSEETREKVTIPEEYLNKLDQFDPRAFTGRGLELRTAVWEELRK